jgi:hypothetical protein
MKKLRDGLLLGLRRGRGRWGSGEARQRCPPVILRRTPIRVVVDLVGEVSSSMAWVEKKAKEGGARGVSEERNERERAPG